MRCKKGISLAEMGLLFAKYEAFNRTPGQIQEQRWTCTKQIARFTAFQKGFHLQQSANLGIQSNKMGMEFSLFDATIMWVSGLTQHIYVRYSDSEWRKEN